MLGQKLWRLSPKDTALALDTSLLPWDNLHLNVIKWMKVFSLFGCHQSTISGVTYNKPGPLWKFLRILTSKSIKILAKIFQILPILKSKSPRKNILTSKFTRFARILVEKGQKIFILVSVTNSGRICEINFIRYCEALSNWIFDWKIVVFYTIIRNCY